jgi:hypothetical protein
MKRPQFVMGAEVHRWAAKVNARFSGFGRQYGAPGKRRTIGWAHLLEI